MAISKGYRFPIEFSEAFPRGLVMVGEVQPDTEFQSQDDRARNRPVRQRIDEATGLRQWKVSVTDPDEAKAKRASFEVTMLAEVQPVPTTMEALPGVRPIELDGLTAEPRVAGNGEFKYLSYVFRATGFREAGAAGGTAGGSTGTRSAGKSAGSNSADKAA
ncbi:hypothetical protein [Actinophytocola glycyrrhizae]|uniref:Plasmid replication, integration and excision activator n=1 Tax=Actinophytocola glycyrrhizae TaxID=2044873 RepID=A0ABV9SAD9_9PSEU